MKWFRWWWLALLVPIIAGFARLHFDAEVLDLLPANILPCRGSNCTRNILPMPVS
jgi:hypothetical protein